MAQKPKAKNPKAKNGAKGYNQLSKPVPIGTTLQDLTKQRWVIGPPIGRGGFGVIYSANAENKTKDYPYVVKFEPHENGPLFVERSFYIKAAQKDDIDKWVKTHKLQYLGLPRYWGSGSHELHQEKYRFLVTDKFGTDLWTKFTENDRQFPLTTVLNIALQTLDVLEYIHSTGYIHGDVKAGNLVLGLDKKTQNKVFLIDFGLVTRSTTDAVYKQDPKTAHNGTLEYLSTDAHNGVPSMRGDVEVLAFNMLHWLTSTLPWEKIALSNTKKKELEVQQMKVKFMDSISQSIAAMKLEKQANDVMKQLFTFVKDTKHNVPPKYGDIRKILQKALTAAGGSQSAVLTFSTRKAASPTKKAATPAKKAATPRRNAQKRSATESSEEEQNDKEKKVSRPRQKKAEQQGKKASKNGQLSDSENSDVESDAESDSDSPAPSKKKKSTAKGSRSAVSTPVVPLWKQSQTAQASGVERPGEYVSQNPKPKKVAAKQK